MGFALPVSPATEWISVASIISSRLMSGRIEERRRAIIDLPEPGGPTQRMLCPPAAATSKARLTLSCPLTSAKSGSESSAGPISGAAAGSIVFSPLRWATSSATFSSGMISTLSAKAASAAFSAGR